MNHSQTTKEYSNESDRHFIHSLVELAKYKYLLADNFYLDNNLSYFLFNAREKIAMTHVYPLSMIEIVNQLFKEEVVFSKEAIRQMENYLGQPLKKNDYISLAEAVIAANYQLDINRHEQEKYLQLLHAILTQITFNLQLPRVFLFSEATRLLTHIKFLALRILKNIRDLSDSDNDLYFFVMERYSKEFHTANQIRVYLTETFDFDLSNDEISYLTMHFRDLQRLKKEG